MWDPQYITVFLDLWNNTERTVENSWTSKGTIIFYTLYSVVQNPGTILIVYAFLYQFDTRITWMKDRQYVATLFSLTDVHVTYVRRAAKRSEKCSNASEPVICISRWNGSLSTNASVTIRILHFNIHYYY